LKDPNGSTLEDETAEHDRERQPVAGQVIHELWSKYTPSGVLTFTVTNAAADKLVNGAEYYVTLDPVK